MEIETIYRKIRNELEYVFATEDNVCFTKKTEVIYKHGNITSHIEKLNFEITNNIPKSYLKIGFNSNQNLFYMIIVSQGKARNITSNDEIEVFNICKKMLKYSTLILEPIDYIEKVYKIFEH